MIIGIIQIGSVESRYDDVYVYMERNENRIGTYRLQPEYTANTSVNAPIRVSKDSTATRPNSRDSWRTSTKVFVQRRACGVRSSNDSIRWWGEGRGVHPRTPNSYLSRSRIVCYACLHIWPGFSVSTSPVLSHLHPREHPILPFRCNRTRLRMSKLTSHPPFNGERKCVSARVENSDYI